MSENTYKKIADELKKEKGFEILIDSANEDEKYLFECCNGDIKTYKDLKWYLLSKNVDLLLFCHS